MSTIKQALKAGVLSLGLVIAGCGGGGSGDQTASTDSSPEAETVEKSFTVSLAHIEVARTSDGLPVTLEASSVSSHGTVEIRH